MKRYFRSLLVPPVFDDESQTILARRLFNILHAILFLSAIFSIPFFLFPTILVSRFTTIIAIVLPLCLLLLEMTRRGWVRLASYSLIVILWMVVTAGAAMAGGVRAPIFIGYLVILVLASLLLGGRPMIAATGLIILSGFGLAFAETNNLLPPPSITYTPYSIFLIYAFFTLSVLVLQQLTWRSLRAALDNLQFELRERRWVEKNLEQRAHEMFLLYQMGKAITGGENLYQALRALVIELKQLMIVDAFYVSLYDETSNSISFPLYISSDRELEIPPRSLVEQPGLTAHVIQTRKMLHLPIVQSPEVQQNFNIVVIADPDISTYVGIPLINEGRILGVLSVQARKPNAYTKEQVRMLETLASQAAIAVDKYNLLGRLQKELAERKQMETALRESEARLRAIIDQFPYDLWICDAEGHYIIHNQASEITFPNSIGKTPAEMENVPAEIHQRWVDENKRALHGETIRGGPYEEMIDGEQRSFITTLAPIVVDDQVIGLTGLSIDVTELRRAEEEVRQLNEELEKRVAERTAEIEQANREMQAFSYSISHDLRAPLRAIRSFGQILKDDFGGQLDPQGRNYLDKVLQSAQEMSELIDSLLALFRIGKTDLRHQPLDLSAEARSVLESLCQAEPDRAVTCRVAEGIFANADESLMRNVLENLLGNAWKYSAQNPEAVIEFGAETRDGETRYFVRDNGAGFDMQHAGKLFQPFQRLHRADEYPGHGIGLATVQRIIQRHGGRIWAESAVGQGATFYFTLG